MATPMKRKRTEAEGDAPLQKSRLSDANDNLSKFVSWCDHNNFQVSTKVEVRRDGSCAQCGMLAVDDIAEGYCLFQIPRTALIDPANSDIADVLESEKSELTATNEWIPLLITLLHENGNGSDSKWAPYLELLPDTEAIDLPMFWDKADRAMLTGSGVDLAVERDLKMIEEDFNNLVLPFIQRHKDKVRCNDVTLETFKKMVAFVMAYSFTEPAGKDTGKEGKKQNGGCCRGTDCYENEEEEEDDDNEETMLPPMMVPMADMLNHVTDNNAKLTFGKDALKMVTTRPIKKGEEIFNTYGQVSNLHLMHMYGFAEPYPDNVNDVVEIPAACLLEAAREAKCGEDKSGNVLLEDLWKLLEEQEIIEEDEVFVLGVSGIMNDDVCSQVLKVLCMSEAEFKEYVENGGWSDDEGATSNDEDGPLDIGKCSKLSQQQKTLLKRMCELHLSNYQTSLRDAEEKMKTASTLPARERYSLYTSHGQLVLLQKYIDACS